jgi:glutaredoxin
MHVVVYIRTGCHRCDHARAILAEHGLTVHAVDIDSDPELAAAYNHCIPVVEIDGKVRFRGQVQSVLLRRLLRAAGGR